MRMQNAGIRRPVAVAAAAYLFALALALGGGVAVAQTTPTTCYPCPTSTTKPGATFTTQFVGTLSAAGFTAQASGFAAFTTVNSTLNTKPAGSDTTDGSGTVTFDIKLVKNTVAFSRPLYAAIMPVAAGGTFNTQVSINGRTYDAQVGSNTLSTTGTGSNGAPRTVNTTFNIVAPGADTSRGGGLPKTGMMVLKWTGAALALIAVGSLIVLADRRRARSRA